MDQADTGDEHLARRLEVLGALATALAHEHSNFMTVALAGLERARDANDPVRRARELDRAEWGVRRAARLTGRILSLARQPLDRPFPAQPARLHAGVTEDEAAAVLTTVSHSPGTEP